LKQVVGHHVPHGARRFVKFAAGFDPERLGNGDLHVIDAVPVPDRLEQPVGETQRHDVLDGFLAQEMVDAIDLVLA
jgi:hypothetical protein